VVTQTVEDKSPLKKTCCFLSVMNDRSQVRADRLIMSVIMGRTSIGRHLCYFSSEILFSFSFYIVFTLIIFISIFLDQSFYFLFSTYAIIFVFILFPFFPISFCCSFLVTGVRSRRYSSTHSHKLLVHFFRHM